MHLIAEPREVKPMAIKLQDVPEVLRKVIAALEAAGITVPVALRLAAILSLCHADRRQS